MTLEQALPLRQVINGDCLEVMRSFPDKSVSVTFTSPPFKDEDVNMPYYEFYDAFMKEVERITINAAFIFNTASRIPEIIKSYPDYYYHLMIWNKNLATLKRRYQPIFVYKYPSRIWKYELGYYCYKDIFRCRPVVDDDSKFHIYQDPVHLYKSILQMLPQDDGIILDPFMGSGTTAIACEQLDRNWLGIEINPANVQISQERIKIWANQSRLDTLGAV